MSSPTTTTSAPVCAERLSNWSHSWDQGNTGFHELDVHPLLKRQFDRLFSGGCSKAFIPLCGKSVDIAWLAKQGITVVGVEGVPAAVEQFFSEQNIDYVKERVEKMKGHGATLYRSNDNKVRIYCGDMMEFNETLEGQFGVIWDRASLVALRRQDVPSYVSILKQLLAPGGFCLLETVDYDSAIMEDLPPSQRAPPPFPMKEAEVKSLYGPGYTVDYLGTGVKEYRRGRNISTLEFIITKTA